MPEPDKEHVEIEQRLAEARSWVNHVSNSLPTAADPLAVSKKAKTPWVALCFREAQAWRTDEFARAACDMFERGDIVVGVTNTRALAESVAAIWHLKNLIEGQLRDGVSADLHERMMRLVMGHKIKDAEMPEAVSVLTMLDKVDAEIPGFRRTYDLMSELAHPNYRGAMGAYSKHDPDTLITYFGRGIRNNNHSLSLGLTCLIGACEIYMHAYNKIGDLLLDFAATCEKALPAADG